MREFLSTIWQAVKSIEFEPKNIIEIIILAVLLYYIVLWIKNSRTWFLFRGILVLLIFVGLANLLELNVITYIANSTLNVLVIALLIIFQPELRQALEQVGQQKYFSQFFGYSRKNDDTLHTEEVTDALIDGAYAMALTKTGALIVLEREINLDEYIKTGIRLDALLSSALLVNIFEHNTPLHDGAVIMRGARIVAATCYLPNSSNPEINKELGTRHRAAIGMSEETDSLVIVVSEETGAVSLAVGGELKYGLQPEELRRELTVMELRPSSKDNAGTSRKKKTRGDKTNKTDEVIDAFEEEQEALQETAAEAVPEEIAAEAQAREEALEEVLEESEAAEEILEEVQEELLETEKLTKEEIARIVAGEEHGDD